MRKTPKVYVCLSNKGGVAKTSTSSLSAEFFALIKKLRCLIIDLDGQLTLTYHWIGHEMVNGFREPPLHPDITTEDLEFYNRRCSITDIFQGKYVEPYRTAITPDDPEDTESPRVDIIPCSASGIAWIQDTISTGEKKDPTDLITHRESVMTVPNTKLIKGLYDFCHNPDLGEFYDVIIIDTGPGVNTFFVAALNAATHVIAPYTPEEFAVIGVGPLLYQISKVNKCRPFGAEQIKLVGLLPTKVDSRNNVHIEIIENMFTNPQLARAHLPSGVFIPYSIKFLRRSSSKREGLPFSIFQMKPSDPLRKRCEFALEHIYSKVFMEENNYEKA